MKEEIVDFILLLISLVLVAFGLYHLKHIEEPQQIVVDHYIDKVKTDTIWLDHFDTLEYFNIDTIYENGEIVLIEDTIQVPVPITAEHFDTTIYQGDTIQTQINGVLSGFNTSLEQLSIRTEITPRTPCLTPSRWSIGVQFGYGITPKGFQPYIGVGVGYRLF